ncbi:MAG TPA: tartrate dehydrogenase [Chloroflexota bacterium]|nr:tartrate dehydrogenase [Chloroflexota bacterium]
MAYRIAVIPGDNIGPEVIREGLKVLGALQRVGYGPYEFTEFPWGAGYYLKTGRAMDEDGIERLKAFDAIYFGAHGDPARVPDVVSSQGLIHPLRRSFDLYVNVRPARLWPGVVSPLRNKDEIDFVVVRENSEGEYSGMGGRLHRGTPLEVATMVSVVSRAGAERLIRFGFELALKRNGKKRVAAATKSNALGHTMSLWDEVFLKVAAEYPDIEAVKYHVDAFSMYLIQRPEWFDVIVATNMFGDILSDEGAAITGGVGLAPGANLDPERRFPSMFEPIHGSAPDIAGKNVGNPLATILAGAMMVDWLGEEEASELVMRAVEEVMREGRVRTRDLGGHSNCSDMGDAVAEKVARLAAK